MSDVNGEARLGTWDSWPRLRFDSQQARPGRVLEAMRRSLLRLLTGITACRTAYHYPRTATKTEGFGDCGIAELSHRLQPTYPNDTAALAWADPELAVWLRGLAHYSQLSRRGWYLDVGCGEGRVLNKFGALFEQASCLEADESRLERARNALAFSDPTGHTKFLFTNARFLEFHGRPGQYDAISCREVLQHIATDEPPRWLKKMHTMLRPGGLLLLSTEWAPRRRYEHSTATGVVDTGVHMFNKLAHTPTPNADGKLVLPVHYWSSKELRATVSSAGFRVLEHEPGGFRNNGRCAGRHRECSRTWPLLNGVASYQWLIARKPGGTGGAADRSPDSPPASSVRYRPLQEGQLSRIRGLQNGTYFCDGGVARAKP